MFLSSVGVVVFCESVTPLIHLLMFIIALCLYTVLPFTCHWCLFVVTDGFQVVTQILCLLCTYCCLGDFNAELSVNFSVIAPADIVHLKPFVNRQVIM